MPSFDIIRDYKIVRSPRVMQLEGIFDIAPSERSSEQWSIDFDLPEIWNIGVIVGPSGSGKSTMIEELWGDFIIDAWEWDNSKSIVDSFPESMSIKDITRLLSQVGFSSPPSWVRPYHILSNGEQFRVHIARTIAEQKTMSVIDEYTSVIDRTVARIGSAAIQKTIRKHNQRLIVASCHYDILDWLEPDWVYKPHTGEYYTGRYLHQRPSINLEVKRVHHRAWRLFGKHHYMNTGFNKAAYCFVAFWHNIPVAFCAVLPFPHPKSPGWRFHRLVCLPDYQGVGIGTALADYIGAIMKASGKPVRRTLAHPAVINAANKSKNWKMTRKPARRSAGGKNASTSLKGTFATKRLVASFEYIGKSQSSELWD